jgi:hypothetical protein
MIKNSKEGVSSTIKPQGFSEIFSMYFPKINTFAHFAPLVRQEAYIYQLVQIQPAN